MSELSHRRVNDTKRNVISRLTPPGKAALATIAVRGPRVWTALGELFRDVRGKSIQLSTKAGETNASERTIPAHLVPTQILVGKLGEHQLADEVVLGILALDPVPHVEIHCHGGPEAVQLIVDLFRERGFQTATWTELAAESWRASPEALELLSRAPTLRTASILLDQARGAFEQLQAMVAGASKERRAELMGRFVRLGPLGKHLVEPWRIVIAGAPNVGKSSLVNAIAGYQRSLVSPIPGTTRDVVSTALAIDGWPIELLDTAGLRQAEGEVEADGVERARATLKDVDLVLWVNAADQKVDGPADGESKVIKIVNKIDLTPDAERKEGIMYISAKTGEGLPELLNAVSLALVPDAPKPGEAVPLDEQQIALVSNYYT